MKMLRVSWLEGWASESSQKTVSYDIPADSLVTAIVGETLVFRHQASGNLVGGHVYLIIPEHRLLSAVEIEEGQ
jgi:hypothetical protein